MTKKKHTKKDKNSPLSKKRLVSIFSLILLFAFLSATISYFLMKNEDENKNITKNEPIQTTPKEKSEELKSFGVKKFDDDLLKDKEIPKDDKFEEITDEFHKVIEKDDDKIEEKKIEDQKLENKKTDEKIKKPEIKKPDEKITEKKKPVSTYDEKDYIAVKDSYIYDKKSKPKIAIIIDDVSTSAQKNAISNVGYKVNMAFLPPTKIHPDSAKIAQNLPFHMIHFPMQASSAFKGEEVDTLRVTDSYEEIEKRVAQLRNWYPKAVYTNNHTGSVFTENEEAIDKLFRALKKHHFIFVDSRTSAKSVVKKYAVKYQMPYIVRNTFIDNERNFTYIQNQLKKAIEIAKKKGYAIAIGHPHSVTIEVLKASKHLFNDVEPIFVNELPYLK